MMVKHHHSTYLLSQQLQVKKDLVLQKTVNNKNQNISKSGGKVQDFRIKKMLKGLSSLHFGQVYKCSTPSLKEDFSVVPQHQQEHWHMKTAAGQKETAFRIQFFLLYKDENMVDKQSLQTLANKEKKL